MHKNVFGIVRFARQQLRKTLFFLAGLPRQFCNETDLREIIEVLQDFLKIFKGTKPLGSAPQFPSRLLAAKEQEAEQSGFPPDQVILLERMYLEDIQ